MTKREGIIQLLVGFATAQETLMTPQASLGDGEPGVTLMPLSWNKSFRELERCLRIMREDKPRLYWHVRERYMASQRVVLELPVRKGIVQYPARHEREAGAPEIGSKTARVRVRRWSSKVDEALVAEGISWLMIEFEGLPQVPDEFFVEA